ncbi:uncharacterized protein [Clytia hemisphaerica]|uniref:Apple domain-containing protein n=1 Tax=Clytia hemisphaerica TaxID=252671 RepID=A0A7M5XIH7_9CNID
MDILTIMAMLWSLLQSHLSSANYFEVERNREIKINQNSILKTTKADSIFICSHHCQLHPLCQFTNYMEEEKQCQLISDEFESGPNQTLVDGTAILTKVRLGKTEKNIEVQQPPQLLTLTFIEDLIPVRGRLIGTIPKQTKSWRIDMDIKLISTESISNNIIRISQKDGDSMNNPGIWFYKDSQTMWMRLATNGKVNQNLANVGTLPIGVFTKLSLRNERHLNAHRFTVHINDAQTFEHAHPDAKEYINMELYCSTLLSEKADVVIKNLVYQNLGD